MSKADTRAPSGRARWSTALRIAISVGTVGYLLTKIDLRRIAAIVAEADPTLLAVALLLFVATRYLMAFRWYQLLRGRHDAATWQGLSRVVLTTSLAGYFMPGGSTEALRFVAVSRATGDPALTVASMLVDRLTAMLALIVIVLVGIAVAPMQLPAILGHFVWLALVAVIAVTALVMLPWSRRLIEELLLRVRLGTLSRRLGKLLRALDSYRDSSALMFAAFVVALIFQLMRVAPVAVIGTALGIAAPVTYYLVIVPVVFLLVALPISVGGLGVREASFVYFLGLAHVPADAAVGISLVAYVLRILASISGAWIYARHGLGMSRT